MEIEIANADEKLTFRPKFWLHRSGVSFSKSSENIASVSVGRYVHGAVVPHIVVETTISQISIHYDELANYYFIQFGTGTTVSSFNVIECQLIANYFNLAFRLL